MGEKRKAGTGKNSRKKQQQLRVVRVIVHCPYPLAFSTHTAICFSIHSTVVWAGGLNIPTKYIRRKRTTYTRNETQRGTQRHDHCRSGYGLISAGSYWAVFAGFLSMES